MLQKYQMERRYINTFLEMLFYTHALCQFDRPKEERSKDNLIILWADEAQRFVTAAEDGMSDFNCVDVMREAKATLVATAQSSTSFVPPLGNYVYVSCWLGLPLLVIGKDELILRHRFGR